jgi:DNA-binding transcriptional ArsR family regulator
MLTARVAAFLRACVQARLSIVFAGHPGAGKTTLLSCTAAELDPALQVVVAEEVFEADIPLPNVAHTQTRAARSDREPVDLRRLVAGFLRMGPDVAIVGEVRDREGLPEVRSDACRGQPPDDDRLLVGRPRLLERGARNRFWGLHAGPPGRLAEMVVSVTLPFVLTYQESGGRSLEALGDPTRRAIFELLVERPLPVRELADALPVSRPAVSQHLKVLKLSGLVLDRAEGTRRIYRVDPSGVAVIREYIAAARAHAPPKQRPRACPPGRPRTQEGRSTPVRHGVLLVCPLKPGVPNARPMIRVLDHAVWCLQTPSDGRVFAARISS